MCMMSLAITSRKLFKHTVTVIGILPSLNFDPPMPENKINFNHKRDPKCILAYAWVLTVLKHWCQFQAAL